MSKVISFQRQSLSDLLEEAREAGPQSRGVLMAYIKPDGEAHFRISGFTGKNEEFYICGLLDWIKADLMKDFV